MSLNGIRTNINSSLVSNYNGNTSNKNNVYSNINSYIASNSNSSSNSYISNVNNVTFLNLDSYIDSKYSSISSFSTTDHSDKDNVNINQIRKIIRDDKNDLLDMQNSDVFNMFTETFMREKNISKKEAEIYSKYCMDLLKDYYGVNKVSKIFDLNDGNIPTISRFEFLMKAMLENKVYKIQYPDVNIDFSLALDVINDYQKNAKDYYNMYSDYITGKTLEDIYSSKNLTDNEIDRIRKELNEQFDDSEDKYGFKKYQIDRITDFLTGDDVRGKKFGISDELMKSKIVEVADKRDTGYSAMVLELKNGNYAIVNSCTNDKEKNDLTSIAFSILNYGCDSKCVNELANNVIGPLLYGKEWSIYQFNNMEKNGTTKYSEYTYKGQIDDCENLIKKYASQDKKLELYGYSLGGGIMEAAYARTSGKNKILGQFTDAFSYADNITSVCVYNPFTLIAEQDFPESIPILMDDEKYIRYCAERDVVSTFNDSCENLDSRTVYIKSNLLSNRDLNVKDLFTGGNHSFSAVNNNFSFDKYGNITESNKGHFVSLKNVLLEVENKQDVESYNEQMVPNYEEILPLLLNQFDQVDKLKNNEIIGESMEKIIDYLSTNYGKLNTNEIIYILAHDIADIAWDKTEKEAGGHFAANFVFDEDDFKSDLVYTLTSDKKYLYKMIQGLIYEDKGLYTSAVNSLVDNYVDELEDDNPIGSTLGSFIAYVGYDKKPYTELRSSMKEMLISGYDKVRS